MRIRYDFHLHSCLSPCGDEDMTPYNLVNMAKLLDLEAIALTDHNTVGNCRSAIEAGRECGITVLPGMELCTSEEIHVVCLFPAIENAEAFGAYVKGQLPPVKNKPEVFGRQLYMDAADGVLGEEPILLVTASFLTVDALPALCAEYGGFCYPAHIDRSSFSVLSAFGMITADMGFTCAEISLNGDVGALAARHPDLNRMRIMRSSDAHYLENMMEATDTLAVEENAPAAIVRALRERGLR
ncbi:PHP domain-containing protein [Ruminococcaceae bacterium OttesenSCG-928-L11]|nr:PHP domain-containing protein [Ruminococcaceae bacterium OttesenSCG-928-L11]